MPFVSYRSHEDPGRDQSRCMYTMRKEGYKDFAYSSRPYLRRIGPCKSNHTDSYNTI